MWVRRRVDESLSLFTRRAVIPLIISGFSVAEDVMRAQAQILTRLPLYSDHKYQYMSGFDSSHVFCFIVHCTYLLVIHATWT